MTVVNFMRPRVLIEASSLVGHSSARYVKYLITPQSTPITSNELYAHDSTYSTRYPTWPTSPGIILHSLPLAVCFRYSTNIIHRISHPSLITFDHIMPTSSTPANLLVIQTPIIHSHRLHTRSITLHARWTSPRVSTLLQIHALHTLRNMIGTHGRQLSIHAQLPHSQYQAISHQHL